MVAFTFGKKSIFLPLGAITINNSKRHQRHKRQQHMT